MNLSPYEHCLLRLVNSCEFWCDAAAVIVATLIRVYQEYFAEYFARFKNAVHCLCGSLYRVFLVFHLLYHCIGIGIFFSSIFGKKTPKLNCTDLQSLNHIISL